MTAPARTGERTGTSRPLRRFDEFEAYRGLAALFVVVFHGYQYTREPYRSSNPVAHVFLHNLDTLVDLFFVLSAFLLTLPWVRSCRGEARPQSGPGYVARRAIRILPVYWVAILLVWATRNPALPGDWRDLVEHLTFTQVFDSTRIFYTIGPAWSLADEVMFYGFLLGVGLLLVRLSARPAPHAATVAWALVGLALVAVGLLWKWWHLRVAHTNLTHWSTWFGPMAKADIFGLGILLAVVVTALPDDLALPPLVPATLRATGLALVAWAWVWRGPALTDGREEYAHTVAAVGFVLLLGASAVARRGSLFERTLATAPLLLLGTISYSLYLWHEPILLLLGNHHLVLTTAAGSFIAGTALLVVLAVAAGWVSYWLVEYPVIQVRTNLDRSGRFVDPYVDAPRRR